MSIPTNTRRPTSHIAPFGVRMQPELKSKLESAATSSGRSLNAEIVARLENSLSVGAPEREVQLQPIAGNLPLEIASTIAMLAKDNGVSFEEMLIRVYAAGISPSAPQVLYLAVHPGATVKDVRAALDGARDTVRSDATVIAERIMLKGHSEIAPQAEIKRTRKPKA